MHKIEGLRREIDVLDQRLMELMESRFHLSREVIFIKHQEGLGTYDSKREEFILARAAGYGAKVEKLYKELLRISKED